MKRFYFLLTLFGACILFGSCEHDKKTEQSRQKEIYTIRTSDKFLGDDGNPLLHEERVSFTIVDKKCDIYFFDKEARDLSLFGDYPIAQDECCFIFIVSYRMSKGYDVYSAVRVDARTYYAYEIGEKFCLIRQRKIRTGISG